MKPTIILLALALMIGCSEESIDVPEEHTYKCVYTIYNTQGDVVWNEDVKLQPPRTWQDRESFIHIIECDNE